MNPRRVYRGLSGALPAPLSAGTGQSQQQLIHDRQRTAHATQRIQAIVLMTAFHSSLYERTCDRSRTFIVLRRCVISLNCFSCLQAHDVGQCIQARTEYNSLGARCQMGLRSYGVTSRLRDPSRSRRAPTCGHSAPGKPYSARAAVPDATALELPPSGVAIVGTWGAPSLTGAHAMPRLRRGAGAH